MGLVPTAIRDGRSAIPAWRAWHWWNAACPRAIRASGSRPRAFADTRNELDSTYEVALAILFLDRLGEKSDSRIIQMLAARLIAGQTATGGWGYKTPKLTASEGSTLLHAIRRFSPPAAACAAEHSRTTGIARPLHQGTGG